MIIGCEGVARELEAIVPIEQLRIGAAQVVLRRPRANQTRSCFGNFGVNLSTLFIKRTANWVLCA